MGTRVLLLLVASGWLACAGKGDDGPAVINNPCEDSQYLSLKAEPVDALSEREYELFREQDRACREFLKITGTIEGPAEERATRPDPQLIEAATRPGALQGTQEIHITNRSTVRIVVTGVRLYECVNIRNPCSLNLMNVTVPAGATRRVMRVRFGGVAVSSSYRYEYYWDVAEDR